MQFQFTPQLMIIEGSAVRAPSAGKECRTAWSRSIFKLVDCPPVPFGLRYLLVGRNDAGRTVTLGIGRALSECDVFNLAEIRHQAASLGAGEVHVLSAA